MSPGRVDTTLALADWLFNFFLVFIFCYLLHTCLTVWTSSASPPPSVSDISTLWSHSPWCTNSPTWTISTKQDQYSCLPGLFTTSLGRSSLAPTSTFFFLLCLWPYQTPLTPPYSTLVVPITGPYPHHEEHSLTPPAARFPRAFFLPSLVRL